MTSGRSPNGEPQPQPRQGIGRWRQARSANGLARRRIAHVVVLSRRSRLWYGTAGVLVVLGIWQLAYAVGWVNKLSASSPSQVVSSAITLAKHGTLWPAFLSTAEVFGIGFGLSLVTGLLVGILLGWYKRFDAVLDPWVSILYAVPRIALIPLIVVWAGVGLKAQIVIVWLIAVFPIIISVSAGVSSIDRAHLQVARSFLATNRDVLLTVALPGAVPAVTAGIRQGLIQALTGVVVAEYFFGSSGLGGLIFTAGLSLQTGQAFVGAGIFAIAAVVFTSVLRRFERRFDRWRA